MEQQGNPEPARLLEQIIEEYSEDVYYCAYLYLNNRDLACDACQQVFLKVHQGLHKFRNQSSYKTWILRITVNTCVSILRSKGYRQARGEVPLEHVQAVEEFPADQIERRLQYDELWHQIQALPQKYREVVILRYYRDYSVKDVAQALRTPQATVRTRLSRAHKLLRSRLVEGGVDFGEGN